MYGSLILKGKICHLSSTAIYFGSTICCFLVIYKIRIVMILGLLYNEISKLFCHFNTFSGCLDSRAESLLCPIRSLFYFLTIWMTSSCSMMCVSPTLWGLYLVLVPWKTNRQFRFTSSTGFVCESQQYLVQWVMNFTVSLISRSDHLTKYSWDLRYPVI